jgi:hypothetical protein
LLICVADENARREVRQKRGEGRGNRDVSLRGERGDASGRNGYVQSALALPTW